MPPILYLIDGHALAYRTYFALTAGAGSDRLQTSKGEPTAGIYGFASVLLRILEQEKPEYLAVAFDTGRTFRNDLFPDYKATRAKMPDDLRPQIERIRQMVDAFNLPRLEQEGVEADDILGTIARQAVASGLGVKIITGDRDLLQLVDERVIVNLAGSRLSEARDFRAAEVKETLGVRPDQVVDYKALVGDHSDNIPGVPGVGEKTALTLLETYDHLDAVYAHLDELPPRVRAKLEAGRELAYLSKDLATIRTDVPVVLDLEQARTSNLKPQQVESFFREMEFRTLTERLRKMTSLAEMTHQPSAQLNLFGEQLELIGRPAEPAIQVVTVTDQSELDALRQKLESADWIALDTETTSTDPMRCMLVGISLAVEPGQGFYIPIGHQRSPQLDWPLVRSALQPVLEDPAKKITGHHLKFDCLVFSRYGLNPANLAFDTMLAEWLLDSSSRRLGLKEMALAYLNVEMTHIEELIGKGKNQISMAEVPLEKAALYAAADAEVTLRLTGLLREKLTAQGMNKLMEEMEMPLVPVLIAMEQAGIGLDVDFLRAMSAELAERQREIEAQIQQAVGMPFNLNSTQQLSNILFKNLQLVPPDRGKKTASGHYSTSAEVLEELRGKHPVVDLILEYRELSKLKSTYLDALPAQINPETGRVHTSYSQTGSVTGRLASSDPNLQNIPIRTELGRQVRKAFVAAPGQVLLSVDYSQIELRIVAHMAQDQTMIAAFRAGQDIHAATAAAIFRVPIEQVSKDQRRQAKAVNFGLIYGMSAFGLSRGTDLTLAEAENFVKAYFEQFPGVKSYLDGIRRQAALQGYVETLFGRKRFFPNLITPINQMMKNREEREAINAPIQGTAADLLKLAMIRLPGTLKAQGLNARILLQVHDELVLECPQSELMAAARSVRETMENVYPLSVPLSTEARWGKNWGEMTALENESI